MPSAPKRPCRTPGCPGLVDSGFCASCTGKGLGKEERPTSAQRGYGYRWQKASKAFLARNPFAVDYFGEHNGRVYRAEVVDHIIPHRGDVALFWDPNNWQPLTRSDHNRKTAMEDGGLGRATDSITLVCGAPGSGKTTYVNQHRSPGDVVWDMDLVAQAISGLGVHQRAPGLIQYLMAMREAFYREAMKPSLAKRIWIIESCPTAAERDRFKREFFARVVLLEIPESVCIERVRTRGAEWPARVSEWFAKHAEDARAAVR